jgi:chromosomal replication initiator protein
LRWRGEARRRKQAAEVSGIENSENGGVAEQWARVRQMLQVRLGKEVFDSWFNRAQIEWAAGGVAMHTVPTAFLRNWINAHYRDLLTELWQGENKSILRADIAVRSAVRKPAAGDPAGERKPESAPREAPAAFAPVSAQPAKPAKLPMPPARAAGEPRPGFFGSPLDARHKFETFIESKSNRMAGAAARTVAENSVGSVRFNPLFLHAGVGLGKTHLLQAIAWEARERDNRRKVLYLTAEYFMWRFAAAIRDHTALSLKESLRDIDLLLIDDMQFLQGKAIQAEFCHLLNELIDSARQVVVAADRPPAELESLDERVRSRLKGGVALEIGQPDIDLRRGILEARYAQALAEQPTLSIPAEVLDYVARQVTTSGRDVEGAFNQLLIRHRFSDGKYDMEELERMLGHLVRSGEARRVRIEDIQKVVARHFNVSKNELLSNRRTRAIVRPRQIAMYLAKILTPRSLPEIGRRFGNRDHTTVLHAVRKIEELSANDQKLAHEIELLKRLILE